MFTQLRAAAAALAIIAVAGSARAQGGQPKIIAYVNTEILMQAAPGRAAAETTYNKEKAALEVQLNKMQDSLKKLYDQYQKDAPKLTDAQKDTRTKAFDDLQLSFQAKGADLQAQLNKRQNDLLAPMTEAVKTAIDDIRVELGYQYVMDNGQGSVIVSADKNLDITDKVVSRLKTMAAKAGTPGSAMSPAAVPRKPPTR